MADIATSTPVALAELQAFLRLDPHGAEDALLAGFIRTASELCEAFIGERLIARDGTETLRGTGDWQRLSARPVQSIIGATGIDRNGVEQPLAGDAYLVDIDKDGIGWLRIMTGDSQRVRISFNAGSAADWNGVPEPLRQGIIRLAAHLYSHRDSATDSGPPTAVAALWRPYRRMRLQ